VILQKGCFFKCLTCKCAGLYILEISADVLWEKKYEKGEEKKEKNVKEKDKKQKTKGKLKLKG
jgi:hypothetical protein